MVVGSAPSVSTTMERINISKPPSEVLLWSRSAAFASKFLRIHTIRDGLPLVRVEIRIVWGSVDHSEPRFLGVFTTFRATPHPPVSCGVRNPHVFRAFVTF